MAEQKRYSQDEGKQAYDDYWAQKMADPKCQAIYQEESARKELWLQLVEARQDAGLTQTEMAEKLGVSQAQVARIEKSGYDAYTLTTLRKYVRALGDGFTLNVEVARTEREPQEIGE